MMSNIEYSVLKGKGGLHNWGFMSSRDDMDVSFEELMKDMDMQDAYSPEVLHQNNFGEYYALQDFEE